jgi:hypothetical protein
MNGVKVMPAVFKREFVGEGMWKEANNVIPDSPPRVLLGISELRGGRGEEGACTRTRLRKGRQSRIKV